MSRELVAEAIKLFYTLFHYFGYTVMYYIIHVLWGKPQLYWNEKNVKQGPPIPILGDNLRTFLMKESMLEMVESIYNRYADVRYVGMYQATVPILMLRDPNLIKQITEKDFNNFVNHRQFNLYVSNMSTSVDPFWGRILFTLKSEKWRESRAHLNVTFERLPEMFTLMNQSAQQYVQFYLNQREDLIEVELKDSFTRFATDAIASCAFGERVDSLSNPKNDFYMNSKKLTNFNGILTNLKFLVTVIAPKLSKVLKISIFPRKTTKFFVSLIKEKIKAHEKYTRCTPDLITLLMRSGKLVEMSENDIAAHVLMFFFAGFETISTVMAFLCYELTINPDVQSKLQTEIDNMGCAQLTYDSLNKMEYLDMVVKESLRKNPPVIVTDRCCTKNYIIQIETPEESQVHLRVGDVVWIPIVAIHHDEKYFPNAMKFDPERFSPQNESKIKDCTYIPFGNGPRSCIGPVFAIMEIKTLIFHILRNFELVLIDRTTVPIIYAKNQFSPYIEGGFWVGLKPRHKVRNYMSCPC